MDANPGHRQMVEFTLDVIPEQLKCGLWGGAGAGGNAYIHTCMHTYIQLRVMCAPLMTAASATRTNKYNKHKGLAHNSRKKRLCSPAARASCFSTHQSRPGGSITNLVVETGPCCGAKDFIRHGLWLKCSGSGCNKLAEGFND